MRLSLMKGAHADLSSTAWQEIGSSPVFGLEWDTTALDEFFFVTGEEAEGPAVLFPHLPLREMIFALIASFPAPA